jgi:hypothetical protein
MNATEIYRAYGDEHPAQVRGDVRTQLTYDVLDGLRPYYLDDDEPVFYDPQIHPNTIDVEMVEKAGGVLAWPVRPGDLPDLPAILEPVDATP